MLRKALPFIVIAIAISAVFSVFFASQRMGLSRSSLDRFMKRDEVEPTPTEEA